MPDLCPECRDPYDDKITGSKATIPENGRLCHHDIEYEGGANTGVWYVHHDTDEDARLVTDGGQDTAESGRATSQEVCTECGTVCDELPGSHIGMSRYRCPCGNSWWSS